MKVRYPDYYKKFRCTAGACEDTCCGGWNISVDKGTLRNYRKVRGSFGKKLKKSVDFHTGSLRMNNGICAFLDTEGLCEIQRTLGEGSLCRTCRIYPRHMEDYGERREYMLMLSCPEAVRLVLGREESDRFVEQRIESSKMPRDRQNNGKRNKEQEGRDEALLLPSLLFVRDTAEAFLMDRSLTPEVRVGLLLALAHDVQNRLDTGKDGEIKAVCRKYREDRERLVRKLVEDMKTERFESRFVLRKMVLQLFEGLETVVERWPSFLLESEKTLYGEGRENYERQRQAFACVWQGFSVPAEHFLVSFTYTYLLGSLYDRALWTKAVFVAVSYLTVKELAFARWKKSGAFTFEDLVEIVHLYSRECEHSDNNLEALEQVLGDSAVFHLDRLLYMM